MVEVPILRIHAQLLLLFAISVGKGHFCKQCFIKIKGSYAHELSLDSAFLGTVSTQMSSSWSVDVTIKQKQVPFKVVAISDQVYHTLNESPLRKPTRVVYGPARQQLEDLGQIDEQILCRQNISMQTIFAIKNLKVNLLGVTDLTYINR